MSRSETRKVLITHEKQTKTTDEIERQKATGKYERKMERKGGHRTT